MKAKKRDTKIIIFIIIVLAIVSILSFFRKFNERKDIINALNSINCRYIGITNSKDRDYNKDIFVSIPYKPVETIVHSNQIYYENMIKIISLQLTKQNFRIIDEDKKIVVAVKNKNGELKYTINGNNNYYENEMAKISKQKGEEKRIQLKVKSQELNEIINNNWKIAKVRNILGTKENNNDNYECYVDEGYSVRTVNLKIFNIVFDEKYDRELFEGIKTGLDNSEIVKLLGEPLFQSDAKPEIGYITKDFYVFFYNGEISIYRIEEVDEYNNNEFAKLVTQLMDNMDIGEFISKVIDIYPDFDKYEKKSDEINLQYSLRGISISYNKNANQGITIYNNFKGKITEDIDLNEVETINSLPRGIYYFDMDSVYQYELKRKSK